MPNSRHQAFTLVELLVVLAITSLLAGMSLAAINTVRDASKTIGCNNNLRQIGLGVAAYATQNDDYLPAAYINNYHIANFDSDCLPGFLIASMDMPCPVLTTEPSNPVKSVFMCPASGSTVMNSPRGSYEAASFATSDEANGYGVLRYLHRPSNSYRYMTSGYTANANAFVKNNISNYPLEEFNAGAGGTLKGKRMSKISPPSSVILMFDGGAIWHNSAVARMAARHRNRTLTNLVFFDGHVAAYPTLTDLQSVFLMRKTTGEKHFKLGDGYESMY